MEPKVVRKASLQVVGMAGTFTPSTNGGIPALWARFAPRMASVPNRIGVHSFGVCVPANTVGGDMSFTYIAAVEVDRSDAVPDGMIALTVPAGRYAVFTHAGPITRIADTVKQVWGVWLPASRHRRLPSPDFELYDDRFDPATGEGEVDIYVPIADEVQG